MKTGSIASLVVSAAVAFCAASAQAAGTSSYVRDGLIACWDGIENAGAGVHVDNTNVWKSVVGGYEFTLNNTIVGDDCMTFTGEKSGGYITSYGVLSAADTTATFVAAKTGTVEIVYRAISTSATQVFLQAPQTSGIAFGIYQTSSFLNFSYNSTNNKQGFAFTSGTDVNLVSMRYSETGPVSAIGNGNALSRQNNGYWGYPNGDTQAYVGARANRQADPFNGSIYCIRLYSRQLTDEEIAANQEVDRKRFILHVGPDLLNVTTSDEGVGSPSPAYGFVRGLNGGQTVSVSCGDAVVTNSNGSVYSCTGWKLCDENSAIVSSGSETSFTYTHPTPAAYRELQWQWEMTSPPTEYAQAGLLAFWDGIENAEAGVHIDGTNVWKDLVHGYEFILTGTTVGDDSMIFDGTSTSYGTLSATDTASTFLAAKSGTLEIVYRSTSTTASQVLLQSTGASGLAYAIWETSKILPYTSSSQASQQSFSLTSGTETNFVAVRYTASAPVSALANGSELQTAGGSSWASPGTETFIGNRATKATGFKGSIYAIRLYDRPLTNPEILANQTIDRLRFSQTIDNSRLVISSTPEGAGKPNPAIGYITGLAAGDTRVVTCGGATTWTNAAETAEYTCTGWKLYDANGNIVDSGNDTAFTYTHPTPAALRRLEWVWQPLAVKGTVAAGTGGSVAPSGTAWYATDTPITVTATPDSGKNFVNWTGALPAVPATAASVTFTPTAPFEMTANFGASFYVASTGGSDDNDGSDEHPFATISNAIEKAAAAIDLNGGSAIIHLAAGTYNETGFVLDRPIVVIGDDRDTVNIYDAVQQKRAFQISHDGAGVMNLTISGTGYAYSGAQGGHVNMSAGTVENCVIRDGYVNQSGTIYTGGGNVFISGGRLLRCQILDGRLIMNGAHNGKFSYGAGIYATGGVVDSCLVKGGACNQNSRCGGVYVDGTAKIVNCTIVDNQPSSGGNDKVSAGIYVASVGATVANSVFYGNGDNSAAANFATVNLERFSNCASSEGNPSCATWKVVTADDFADYATGNFKPIAGSKLVDAGSVAARPAEGAPLDLDGDDRVSGVEVDIGAWEYDQSGFSYAGYPSSYAMLEQTNVTFRATAIGSASDVVFRWDYGNGVTEDTRETAHVYRYPAAGLFTVRLAASPDGGVNWGEWYTVPTRVVVAAEVMYVDSNCATPEFPYKTKATAATTLAVALNALTNSVSGNVPCVDGVEVRIVKGSRLTETGMRLECAMAIVGDTDDPNDAEIVDAVQQKRAFVISHPQARVANLKISGTGYAYSQVTGGHVQLFDGTVENCIIRDGYVNQSGTNRSGGGNVFISGGRLLRCQILDGRLILNNAHNGNFSYGAGIYATGGVVDSCLVKGGACYKNSRCGGVYVDGTAKIVNCTIVDNLPSSNGGDTVSAGIYVASANATVANCAIYGNGVNSAAANFATVNLDRFFYCASSETNASCATWKVIDETAFSDWSRRNEGIKYLSPKKGGALVDGGSTLADYAGTYGGTATVDLLGNARKTGRSLDIGCFEIVSGFTLIVR